MSTTKLDPWPDLTRAQCDALGVLFFAEALEQGRPGGFPLDRPSATSVGEADVRLGGREVLYFQRPAMVFCYVLDSEGLFEVFRSDRDDPIGVLESEEFSGVISLTPVSPGGQWWVVAEGDLAGTVWGEWEEQWVPFSALTPRLRRCPSDPCICIVHVCIRQRQRKATKVR